MLVSVSLLNLPVAFAGNYTEGGGSVKVVKATVKAKKPPRNKITKVTVKKSPNAKTKAPVLTPNEKRLMQDDAKSTAAAKSAAADKAKKAADAKKLKRELAQEDARRISQNNAQIAKQKAAENVAAEKKAAAAKKLQQELAQENARRIAQNKTQMAKEAAAKKAAAAQKAADAKKLQQELAQENARRNAQNNATVAAMTPAQKAASDKQVADQKAANAKKTTNSNLFGSAASVAATKNLPKASIEFVPKTGATPEQVAMVRQVGMYVGLYSASLGVGPVVSELAAPLGNVLAPAVEASDIPSVDWPYVGTKALVYFDMELAKTAPVQKALKNVYSKTGSFLSANFNKYVAPTMSAVMSPLNNIPGIAPANVQTVK